MIEFRLSTHSMTERSMVEVWRDGIFVASIYEHEGGVRLVSKYYDGVEHDATYPPAVLIKLGKGS